MLRREQRAQEARLRPKLEGIEDALSGISGQIDDVLSSRHGSASSWDTIYRTLDLDEVLERTLEAAGALSSLDGARIHAPRPDQGPATKTRGRVSADPPLLSGPPDGSSYAHAIVSWLAPEPGALRSGLAVPFAGGSLEVFSSVPHAFSDEDAELLAQIAARAEPAVANAMEHLRVIAEAATDPLTGLGSARAFADALPRAINTARRTGRPLSVIQIDLDDFGEINKHHPRLNAAGDDALAGFGAVVRSSLRDPVFRHSGGADEFFVILEETRLDDARRVYRRLAGDLEDLRFGPDEDVGPITMSSGLALLRADDTGTSLLARVSHLARVAKETGKNRLVGEDDA